jgi:threonine dehydrogenase-like Zn-dependent dehydrogenase
MRAITYQDVRRLRLDAVPDPGLEEPGDAIVEVERTAICGSDLHVYLGRERGLDPGTVMGHEFMGRVVEAGAEVRVAIPGTRVVAPFSTACGACFFCVRGLSARCVRGALFGWVEKGRGLHGAQATHVRVPMADATLVSVPEDLPAESALLLADILPTGRHCVAMAAIERGDVVAVLGCGPVGLMAVACAVEEGARVHAIDTVPERLALAARLGAMPVPLDREATLAAIRDATEGRGADAVLEVVGSPDAARLAFDLVRAGGVISAVGVHHEAAFPFSPVEAYDRNLRYAAGRCPARSRMDALVPMATRRADLAAVFTHRWPLARGAEAYEVFEQKADGCIKVALDPRA